MSTDSRRDLAARATRADILRAARGVFGRDGFEAAALGDIANAAKVTTGALYHHFKNKKDLFRAVAEDLEREILERVGVTLATVDEPRAQLRAGIDATLALSTDAAVARILIHDASSVIGAARWREIEKRYAFGTLIAILTAMRKAGNGRIRNPELTASILLGALLEAATTVSMARDQKAALAAARAALGDVVDALVG